MPNPYLGRTIALTSCPAWDVAGVPVKISGLYSVEDFIDIDLQAGLREASFIVYAADEHTGASYEVLADSLWEQADPASYGRALADEREAELASC